MEETPATPKPLESLQDMKEELTALPPEAIAPSETVEKVNVVKHSELPYAPPARFQPGKVKDFINKLLKEKLGSLPAYDFEAGPHLSRELADLVRSEIRDMNLPRYKIMVQSVIGESRNQGFQFASKSLWDNATDDCSFGSFLNEHVFGVVGAWVIYFT